MGCEAHPSFELNVENNETQKDININIGKDENGKISHITYNGEHFDDIHVRRIQRCINSPREIRFGDNIISGEDASITTPEGKFSLIGKLSDDFLESIHGGSSNKEVSNWSEDFVFQAIDNIGFDVFEDKANAPFFNYVATNWEYLDPENKTEFLGLMKSYIETVDVEYGLGEININQDFQAHPRQIGNSSDWEFSLSNTGSDAEGDLIISY